MLNCTSAFAQFFVYLNTGRDGRDGRDGLLPGAKVGRCCYDYKVIQP